MQAANARRGQVPWVMALGHRPMYCVVASRPGGRCNEEHEASRLGLPSACPHNNPRACRPRPPPAARGRGGGGQHEQGGAAAAPSFPIEELFNRHGVDLAVFGHVRRLPPLLVVLPRTHGMPASLSAAYPVHKSPPSPPPPPLVYCMRRSTTMSATGPPTTSASSTLLCPPPPAPLLPPPPRWGGTRTLLPRCTSPAARGATRRCTWAPTRRHG